MSPRERQALSDVMDPATVVYQRGHYARRRAEALGASLPVVPLYGCLDAMCNREHFMSNRGRWHFDAEGPEFGRESPRWPRRGVRRRELVRRLHRSRGTQVKIRWWLWRHLIKLPFVCNARAHSVLIWRDGLDPRIDAMCRRDCANTGHCWCGKLSA